MSTPTDAGSPFERWTRIVYGHVHKALNDVHARRNRKGVRILRGSLAVDIIPDNDVWWVHFDKGGVFGMPPLCVSIHSGSTARNVAKTILGFFEPALSTPDQNVQKESRQHIALKESL